MALTWRCRRWASYGEANAGGDWLSAAPHAKPSQVHVDQLGVEQRLQGKFALTAL